MQFLGNVQRKRDNKRWEFKRERSIKIFVSSEENEFRKKTLADFTGADCQIDLAVQQVLIL